MPRIMFFMDTGRHGGCRSSGTSVQQWADVVGMNAVRPQPLEQRDQAEQQQGITTGLFQAKQQVGL